MCLKNGAHLQTDRGGLKENAPALIPLTMRILLIEDEKKTTAFISKGLEEAGYSVECARDGEAGLELALGSRFRPAPGRRDAAEEGRLDRSRRAAQPRECTRRFFFSPRAIACRIASKDSSWAQTITWSSRSHSPSWSPASALSCARSETQHDEQLRIEDLELDTRRHRAVRAGDSLHLTAKEFLLLAHLVRSAGEVVSRKEIESHVWGIDFQTGTNVLDVMVRRLRAKVDDPYPKKAHPHRPRRRLCPQSRLNRGRSLPSWFSSLRRPRRSFSFAGSASSTGSSLGTPTPRTGPFSWTRSWPFGPN